MMKRSLSVLFLALAMICFIPRSHAQQGKSEFAIGYGGYSFYSFLNVSQHYGTRHTNSSGISVFNYKYYVSRQVTLGLGLGYENISTWGTFFTIAPELTVAYLDTRHTQVPRVRLYGEVAMGVSIFGDGLAGNYGHADQSGAKPWAFQLTPIGVRVGRQVAGYLEAGFGYKGIIHGGLEIRVPRFTPSHKTQMD